MVELSRQERAFLLKEAIREVLDDPARHDELKQLFKVALNEWLDGRWAAFGKWTFGGAVAMLFAVLIWLYARAKGLA